MGRTPGALHGATMGADVSCEQAGEQAQAASTAVVRRRGASIDSVHQLLNAAIIEGTKRLIIVNKNIEHINDRLGPIIEYQLNIDERHTRLEANLDKIEKRLGEVFSKLEDVDTKLNRLVLRADDAESRDKRLASALNGDKTTLRRKAPDALSAMPAEERFRMKVAAAAADAKHTQP